MAELATIARPYADALFKAQSADLAGTAAWLDELAAVASNTQLLQFSENPKVTDAQVFELISGVVKTTLPAAAQNFLRLAIENHRLVALPEIASQFRALKNAQGGTADAIVHSAFPIEAAALADLSGTLEKRFGRKLNVSVVDRCVTDWWRSRGRGGRGARHFRQGPSGTNESGSHCLMQREA